MVKHLPLHLVFDFRKIKSRTKIPITIKRIATTAIIIPIISSLPIVSLKIMKYNACILKVLAFLYFFIYEQYTCTCISFKYRYIYFIF